MNIYFYPRLTLFGRRWFVRGRGRNGRIVFQSEGYHNRLDAKTNAELIKREAAGARIIELSSNKEEMP